MPLSPEARARKNERTRQWRKLNPHRHQELQRAWRRKNPDKTAAISKRTRAKNRARVNAGQKRWRAANPEKIKAWDRSKYLKRRNVIRAQRYGVPLAEIERLMLTTACEACGVTFEAGCGCIDHDHESGVIRGVLCKPCNYALGIMLESAPKLRGLAIYAERVVPQCAEAIGRAILAAEGGLDAS